MIYVDYNMPVNGLGTDFSNFERPLSFAATYTNRFRNVNGGAERRPGMSADFGSVSGNPNLTRLHEYVSPTGTETLMVSDDSGNLWSYSSAWSSILTGKTAVRMISAQAKDKLIFCNGVDRNYYTDNAGVTFQELKAYITRGQAAGGSGATTLIDGNISNWVNNTLVSNNDLVYNVTLGAYGIVSTVASASLTHTVIGSAATGAGNASRNQDSGDQYQLIDYVAMNIIPSTNGASSNVATATTGTNTTTIAVSGVNFSTTEARKGDFVYNTTRSAVSQISVVGSNLTMQQAITGQTSGDALVFLKSAMPIASWIHVHYGRVYYVDSRNQTRVVISAPDDPEDLTTYQQTLDATSFSFGTQQPTGDAILTLGTFQSYFVAAGKKNLYIYSGDNPIADSSTSTVTFNPLATYPYGTVSRFCVAQNGGNLLYTTINGLQAVGIGNISNTTVQSNASTPIRQQITDLIKSTSNADDIQLTFYPSRAWLIQKVGDSCYILNSNPTYDASGQLQQNQAWHLFNGKWAQQNHYFVRRNGTLLACGSQGLVYSLDSSAATDNGTVIQTDLTTAWVRLEEPQRSTRIKQGQYIKPVFESGPNIEYTINVVAGWDNLSSDSIVVSSGDSGQIGVAIIGTTPIGEGAFAQAAKQPFRWRGEQARIQFTTQSSASPDIITGYSLYGEIHGVR